MKLTTLGSRGWIPTGGRHTCCYCLEYRDTLIIFDAGTGLARLEEPWGRDLLNRYDKALLFLSHYHLDHTVGLNYLPYFFKDKNLHIAGPGLSVYGKSVKEILGGLLVSPYFGRPLMEFPMDLSFQDLEIGVNRVEGLTVETVLQEHSDPSLGIKIDHRVSYVTDSVCNRATVDFVRGSGLLLHEAWFDTRDYTELIRQKQSPSPPPHVERALKIHSSVGQVVEAARDASVESLLLIHLNPSYDENRLLTLEQEARQIFPDSRLAQEGHASVYNL